MSSILFETLRLLDKEKVYYRLERTRVDTIQINATFAGARVEIEIFEDGHIELSRFLGDETVESGGSDLVDQLVKDYY